MGKAKISFKYKLMLDIAMVIVLSLLFRKNTLGMAFHEIAGLIILAVFIIHVALNRSWVFVITRNLLSSKTTIRAKICWLIDCALVICFVLIGLSGILMSKVVFHFNVAGNWKTLHYFCAALALILAGAHLGMHGAVIGHSIARLFKKIPVKTVTVVFGVVSLVIIAFGAYSLTSTSFSRWITMPFESQSASPERMPINFSEHTESEKPDATAESSTDAASGESSDAMQSGESSDAMQSGESSDAMRSGESSDAMQSGDNAMMAHGDKMQVQRTPGSMILGSLQTFIQFFSIMYFFAAITCVIDMVFMNKKKVS